MLCVPKAAIYKINIRLYSWKRIKNLAKSFDCAINTDTTPVLAASSTATADEILQTVGFQNPNPQIKKSDSCHQVSGVTAFQHLCNRIPLLAILTKLWIANHKSWHPSPQSNGEITWDRATNQIYFHPSMSVKFHPKEDLGVD